MALSLLATGALVKILFRLVCVPIIILVMKRYCIRLYLSLKYSRILMRFLLSLANTTWRSRRLFSLCTNSVTLIMWRYRIAMSVVKKCPGCSSYLLRRSLLLVKHSCLTWSSNNLICVQKYDVSKRKVLIYVTCRSEVNSSLSKVQLKYVCYYASLFDYAFSKLWPRVIWFVYK